MTHLHARVAQQLQRRLPRAMLCREAGQPGIGVALLLRVMRVGEQRRDGCCHRLRPLCV